jgi:hypothetical protein
MDLRQAIQMVITEWPAALQRPFRDSALANFIRTEFPKVVEEALGSISADYFISGSPGAGNWASVPWLSILDKEITQSTMDGFYPVYSFRADMSGVYLSLIQGTTGISQRLGRKEATIRMEIFCKEVRSAASD